jgi:hypothetical protein
MREEMNFYNAHLQIKYLKYLSIMTLMNKTDSFIINYGQVMTLINLPDHQCPGYLYLPLDIRPAQKFGCQVVTYNEGQLCQQNKYLLAHRNILMNSKKSLDRKPFHQRYMSR